MGAPGTSTGPFSVNPSPSIMQRRFLDIEAPSQDRSKVVMRIFCEGNPTAEADAHQIAASGELYDALEAVEKAMLPGGDGAVGDFGWSITDLNRARPAIRAALALARGEKAA